MTDKEFRNVQPMLTRHGLYRVTPEPQADENGQVGGSTPRPYNHFYIADASNGVPATSVRPVVVDAETEGVYTCSTHRIYPHQDGEYIIQKPLERIGVADFYLLPILLFPGDKLTHLSGLEAITLDTQN